MKPDLQLAQLVDDPFGLPACGVVHFEPEHSFRVPFAGQTDPVIPSMVIRQTFRESGVEIDAAGGEFSILQPLPVV